MNRLVKVVSGGTTLGEYRFDGLNRRIRKYTNPVDSNWTVREYYYNTSWQVLEVRKDTESRVGGAEPDVAETVYEQYVWIARYIDSPVLRDRDVEAGGDLGKEGSGLDERLYYLTDANFNVTALVEPDGDVAERYVYTPYGVCTIYTHDWSATVAWDNSKRNEVLYCGYRLDPETGTTDDADALAATYQSALRSSQGSNCPLSVAQA